MVKTIYTKNIYRKKKTSNYLYLSILYNFFSEKKKKKKKEVREGKNKSFSSQLFLKHINDKLKAIFKILSSPILNSSDRINVFGKEHNKTIPQSLYLSLSCNSHTH